MPAGALGQGPHPLEPVARVLNLVLSLVARQVLSQTTNGGKYHLLVTEHSFEECTGHQFTLFVTFPDFPACEEAVYGIFGGRHPLQCCGRDRA